jgi:conjugative transfer signal peptidase TraF
LTPPLRMMVRSLIIGSLSLAGIWVLCYAAGISYVATDSIPVGYYIKSKTGSYLAFCPEGALSKLTTERHYRADAGAMAAYRCSDGAAPMLKPSIARENDVVDVDAEGLFVNGVLIPNTAPLAADSLGRPLPALARGAYVVQKGEVWVASSYNPRSFDSRYFGPISITTIRERLSPFLVWH